MGQRESKGAKSGAAARTQWVGPGARMISELTIVCKLGIP
jgi:hypothetical protein